MLILRPAGKPTNFGYAYRAREEVNCGVGKTEYCDSAVFTDMYSSGNFPVVVHPFPNPPSASAVLTDLGVGVGNPSSFIPLGFLPQYLLSADETVLPPLQASVEISLRKKSQSSYLRYLKSQETGEILLNDYLAYRLIAYDAHSFHGISQVSPASSAMVSSAPEKVIPCPFGQTYNVKTMQDPAGYPPGVYRNPDNVYGPWYAYQPYALFEASASTVFDQLGRPQLDAVVERLLEISPDGALSNKALADNYSGVYDVLTELGELPETVKFVLSTLKDILRLFKSTKRSIADGVKNLSVKDAISFTADKWMAYRYAVQPLVYSVKDMLEFVELRNAVYVTTRKRRDVPFSFSIGNYTYTGVAETRVYVKSRVNPESVTRHLGLNPLATAWEIAPLSFVVDWVLPIGDALASFIRPSSLEQVEMMYSTRVRRLETQQGISIDCDFYNAVKVIPQTRLPCVDVQITFKRKMDALALGWNLFIKQYWKS